jgi:hypothetical protein
MSVCQSTQAGTGILLLLAEEIPEIQALHIHQIMIDHREVPHRKDERDDYRDDRIIQRTHILFSSFSSFLTRDFPKRMACGSRNQRPSTGTLNSGKPIEKPEPKCTGDVENHLADFDLDLTILRCCRCHR